MRDHDRIVPGLISRARDPHYRSLLRWDAEARVLMRWQLRRLSAYHEGRHFDFTSVRDRYLTRIVRFARKKSTYYAENLPPLDGGGLVTMASEWGAVPLLDKTTIRQRLDGLMTAPPDCPWVGRPTTGGSTGEPFGFPQMGGHDAEHQEFLWRMHGYREGDRILALDGTLVGERDLEAGRYWVRKAASELPYGGTALSGHYLSAGTEDAYVNFLQNYNPEFIRGYPSLLAELATLLQRRGIRLNCKAVEMSSESHTNEQVDLIESVFGPTFDQYGHAEASLFGYSLDAQGPIFCSPMYGLVEVLDDAGRPVSSGETGEVVVTGFHNFAMPFIRYRTGDLAVFDSDSDGIVRLREVIGRTQDVLISADGEKHLLTALVFGRHYSALARIERWQLVQDVPGVVLIRVVRGAGYGPEDEEEIRRNFRDLARIDAFFDYESGIGRTGRAKAPWVIQRAL